MSSRCQCAEAPGQHRQIPLAVADVAAIQSEATVEDAARSAEAGGGETRRYDTAVRRPAGVQTLHPRAVGQKLHRARRLASGEPKGVGELQGAERRYFPPRCTGGSAAHAGGMKAAVVEAAGSHKPDADVHLHAEGEGRQQRRPVVSASSQAASAAGTTRR